MTYLIVALACSTIVNFITLLIGIKQLKLLQSLNVQKEHQELQNENDIHNILNSRLLDLQNRRYSLRQHGK